MMLRDVQQEISGFAARVKTGAEEFLVEAEGGQVKAEGPHRGVLQPCHVVLQLMTHVG